MRKSNLPWYMTGVILASLLVSVVCVIANLRWKLSEHMAGAGGIIGGRGAGRAVFWENSGVSVCLFILIIRGVGAAGLTLGEPSPTAGLSGSVGGGSGERRGG